MSMHYLAAAIQMCSGPDQDENLARAERLVGAAAAEGARLVALPELFACYGDLQLTVDQAEPLNGSLVMQLRSWAEKHSLWLAAGSIAERDPANQHVYNTSLLIDPWGRIAARYRKRHQFNIDLAQRVQSCESRYFTAGGDDLACVSTPCGVLGLSICYDLRFPEQFRDLSRMGTEVLIVPSAFTQTTGRDHWELLIRARAVENQCYLLAANQVGQHSALMSSYGHSCVIDPWGSVLATVRGDDEGLAIAEIDEEFLRSVRKQLPALVHRRDIAARKTARVG